MCAVLVKSVYYSSTIVKKNFPGCVVLLDRRRGALLHAGVVVPNSTGPRFRLNVPNLGPRR